MRIPQSRPLILPPAKIQTTFGTFASQETIHKDLGRLLSHNDFAAGSVQNARIEVTSSAFARSVDMRGYDSYGNTDLFDEFRTHFFHEFKHAAVKA